MRCGLFLFAAFFVDLGEMIADFAVLIQQPGGANVAFGLVEIAFAKIHPAESVPVDADARDLIEIVEREVREIDVAQIGGSGGDGGFGILRGLVELEIVLGESVGHVVPHHGRLRQLHSFFECFQRFIFFTGVEEGLAEADFQFGVVRSENRGFIELRDGFAVFVLFEKKRAERGVRNGIERIHFDLFSESVGGFRDISAVVEA